MLRFVTVVLDPEVMTGPLGLKIAAVFQDTRSKPESDQIHYKVAPAGLDGLPAIKWLRKVPATEHGTVLGLGRAGSSGGESLDGACGPEELLIDAEEPNVLLCFDAEDFATRVQRDSLASVYSTLQRHCPGHMPHFLVLRLEQYLQKRERADHKRAMTAAAGSSFAAEGFQRRPVDDFLARMLVECPHAAFRDVGSPEEGAAHVVSLTKAVAERYIAAAGDAAVYLSGRAGNKSAKGTAASLLASFPIQDQSVRTLMHALTALPSVGPQIAHVVASKYGSLGALIEFLFDPGTLPAQKIAEIEHLQRPGGQGAKRVGPKAARQIFDVLTGSNPDVLMHGSGD